MNGFTVLAEHWQLTEVFVLCTVVLCAYEVLSTIAGETVVQTISQYNDIAVRED